ncbi:MAG: serine hydrolase domain-containing protein, partial [Thermoanaerobaculia bacterium]|nr:serine hydrolase domain-containing protein [Thermoanaerobaculia bacterium]
MTADPLAGPARHLASGGPAGAAWSRRDFVRLGAAAVAGAGLSPTLAGGRTGRRFSPAELQQVLDDAARALGIVGAQLAVFDGSDVIELATGSANLELGLEATADTLFQIGSTTKVMNACVVMSLVDEGVLDLDRPVRTWIDGFRLADRTATRGVTLRQLLSMSAGVDNGPYTDHGRGDDALSRYVASLAEVPHVFAPGTAFGYSNAGTCIAGLAAQRAAGKSWETLLEERILAPLGLERSASFGEDLLFHSVSLGYRVPDTGREPERVPVWALPRSMAPAGATHSSSAGDLVRVARKFLAGGRSAGGGQVLSPTSVATLHRPQVTLPARLIAQRWCTGPYWKQWGGEVIYGHSGTNSGGSSLLLWCPARNVAAATIANVPSQGYPLADRV